MGPGRGPIGMIGKKAIHLKTEQTASAAPDKRLTGVQECRWEMTQSTVTGESIGREGKAALSTKIRHMPRGVPGQVHRLKSVPDIDEVAVVQKPVGNERLITQRLTAQGVE